MLKRDGRGMDSVGDVEVDATGMLAWDDIVDSWGIRSPSSGAA